MGEPDPTQQALGTARMLGGLGALASCLPMALSVALDRPIAPPAAQRSLRA